LKAIVYTNYGPPEVLRIKEVETPVPKNDEVLIKVHAAEATKSDCELRRFNFPVKWFWLPLRIAMGIRKPRRPVFGGYFYGEIESIVDRIYQMEQAAEAHRRVETEQRIGSVVISIDS
jgi:NADPH:quinone reductase-like Zn-dependent oxidoreductase|tara:strand:+ start:2895 stop:3248 length:354 start_codon:yes stop_codon:yes gene_type:complete